MHVKFLKVGALKLQDTSLSIFMISVTAFGLISTAFL